MNTVAPQGGRDRCGTAAIRFSYGGHFQKRLCDLAAAFARALPEIPCPRNQRAQGRPGARCTRGLMCKLVLVGAHEHTGSAETLRPSLRNGFTAYIALSPATNSFLSPSPADKSCLSPVGPTRLRRLGISNGCQDHTVLPYASAWIVCVPPIAHGPFASPPCHHVSRPTLSRPPRPAQRS